MGTIDLTTTTSIPTNTGITLHVYEDEGNTGTGSYTDPNGKAYDYHNSVALAGGTNETNTVSGFAAGSGNAYWIRPVFSIPNVTTTPRVYNTNILPGVYDPPIIVIDDFNGGMDAAWTGDRAEFTTSATAFEGSHSLLTSGALSRTSLTSTEGGGLPAYFHHGERMKVYLRAVATGTGGPGYQGFWAYQGANNWWRFELNFGNGNFEFTKYVAGTATDIQIATVNVSAGTWYEVIVTRDDGSFGGVNHDLTVELRNADTNTTIQTLTGNDSNHATVAGLRHEYFALGSGEIHTDFQHKPG